MANQMQTQVVPQPHMQIVPAINQQTMYAYAVTNGNQIQPTAYLPHANSVVIGPSPGYVAQSSYHSNNSASMVHQVYNL